MKLYISHPNSDRVKNIVNKMVEAAGRAVLIEKPNLDSDLINQIVEVVKNSMAQTMAILLIDSSNTIIEFDIENSIGKAFEDVAKYARWELDQEKDNDEKIDNVDHHQV